MLENQGYPEPSTCLEIEMELVVPLLNYFFFFFISKFAIQGRFFAVLNIFLAIQ